MITAWKLFNQRKDGLLALFLSIEGNELSRVSGILPKRTPRRALRSATGGMVQRRLVRHTYHPKAVYGGR